MTTTFKSDFDLIADALATPTFSVRGREYLENLDASTPRLWVLEDVDGTRAVYYGAYTTQGGDYFEGVDVPVEWVIEAAQSDDFIPADWEDAWDLVEVYARNAAYGVRVTARS